MLTAYGIQLREWHTTRDLLGVCQYITPERVFIMLGEARDTRSRDLWDEDDFLRDDYRPASSLM